MVQFGFVVQVFEEVIGSNGVGEGIVVFVSIVFFYGVRVVRVVVENLRYVVDDIGIEG